MADPREINYHNGEKLLNKELTEQKISEAVTPVATALEEEVSRATAADGTLSANIGDLAELNTANKESLVAAVNEVYNKIPEESIIDPVPTEGSEHSTQSGGTFNAIRFASAKVGDTMFWHESETVTREVHSDNPFVFNFKGQEYSVTPEDGEVEMIISKNYPDGWHALDGTAELSAAEYPDLAAFMPENVTTDGKIWLPYVQQKIIKIRY